MFEYALIELNKVQAPSLLLEDYNYFINKAVNQYVNKVYNMYDVNQQKSDDVRVLKSTAVLVPELQTSYDALNGSDTVEIPEPLPAKHKSPLFKTTYEVDLPDDYLHILNCVVEYEVDKNYKCYDKGDRIHFGATRLTSDMFAQIINNYYMRPSYKQPYFYINNVTTKNDYKTTDNQDSIEFNGDNVEKIGEERFGNTAKVRMEIRYGKDDTLFKLSTVYIDYLKAPQFIRLTQDQVDQVIDTSQVLEFQDYVCQEIVNELVMLLLENASDPRIQSHPPINQSIANPAQEGQEQQRKR